jgi:hypothetical protein
MEEKETTAKASIEALLASLLPSKRGGRDNTKFVHEPIKIGASPEEGVHLIRAFIRIRQPELRAAIIKLVTEMADDRAWSTPVQN